MTIEINLNCLRMYILFPIPDPTRIIIEFGEQLSPDPNVAFHNENSFKVDLCFEVSP